MSPQDLYNALVLDKLPKSFAQSQRTIQLANGGPSANVSADAAQVAEKHILGLNDVKLAEIPSKQQTAAPRGIAKQKPQSRYTNRILKSEAGGVSMEQAVRMVGPAAKSQQSRIHISIVNASGIHGNSHFIIIHISPLIFMITLGTSCFFRGAQISI